VEADVTWMGKGLVQDSAHQILFYFFTSATTKPKNPQNLANLGSYSFGYFVLIHIRIAQAN
jgi:hypothetical protein